MTDLHTHILPGIDDGAKSVEASLEMLRMEQSQGVDTVVLTPHFYRDQENPKRFLQRRKDAVLALGRRVLEMTQEERDCLPRMVLGAEVAWWPTMAEWDELPELCIGETKHMLLELPFSPWNDRMIDQLHEFYGRTGITPVLAHLERYMKIQRQEYIDEVLRLGFPVQVSADVLLRPLARGRVLKMLRQGQAQIVASDCHECSNRVPNLAAAAAVLNSKLGLKEAERIFEAAESLMNF